jgi:hypothetical protein
VLNNVLMYSPSIFELNITILRYPNFIGKGETVINQVTISSLLECYLQSYIYEKEDKINLLYN